MLLASLVTAGCNGAGTARALASSSAQTSAGTAGDGSPALSDAALRRAVTRALAHEPDLASSTLTVDARRGAVTVSGSSGSLADARRAVALAESVRGVSSVSNAIAVRPAPRSDGQIESDLRAAILRELPGTLQDADLRVDRGVVRIEGTISSWAARDLLEELAAETKGVRALDDRLVVTGGAARESADLRDEVRARIARDAWLDGARLDVSAKSGVVYVAGVVGTLRQRARVERDAGVPGARLVDTSSLRVDPVLYDRTRLSTPPPVTADLEVARAIRGGLRLDPRVGDVVPEVEVVDGVATLSGVVATGPARAAAEQIARDTVGVRSVLDETRIAHVPMRPDADVLREAGDALRAGARIAHPEAIALDLSRGALVVRGSVQSAAERARVRRALQRIPGVASIDDRLSQGVPPAQGTGADVAERARARLADDAELAGDRIDVDPSPDGTLSLRGSVRTWGELRAATEDALVAGAPKVVNLLSVTSVGR